MLLAEKIKLIVALKRKGKERMVEEERKRRKGEEREGQDGREEEMKLMSGFQEWIVLFGQLVVQMSSSSPALSS